MCCSVNVSVCFVCCVFVNCLVKQFAMCLGVVAILLLNIISLFSDHYYGEADLWDNSVITVWLSYFPRSLL